jgi:hypothetical protein
MAIEAEKKLKQDVASDAAQQTTFKRTIQTIPESTPYISAANVIVTSLDKGINQIGGRTVS